MTRQILVVIHVNLLYPLDLPGTTPDLHKSFLDMETMYSPGREIIIGQFLLYSNTAAAITRALKKTNPNHNHNPNQL